MEATEGEGLRSAEGSHDWTATALTVIVLVNARLHWEWIVGMTRSYFSHK